MRREIHHQVRQQQKVMRSESIPLEVNLAAPRISEAQVAKDSARRNLRNIFQAVLVTKYLRRR
jgi:hypothetical protein